MHRQTLIILWYFNSVMRLFIGKRPPSLYKYVSRISNGHKNSQGDL